MIVHAYLNGALRRYPIRQTTTLVPVDGGVAGGGLPMSAGSSFHGRRQPNGSACQRRTMAGVQEGGEARDQRDVAVEVLRGREAPAPAVDDEQGAGVRGDGVLVLWPTAARSSTMTAKPTMH